MRLWEEGAKEPKTLLLQSSTERRGGQPVAVAAVRGEGPVMLVDGKMLADLAPGVAELRDRALLPAFEIGDVKKARVAARRQAPGRGEERRDGVEGGGAGAREAPRKAAWPACS